MRHQLSWLVLLMVVAIVLATSTPGPKTDLDIDDTENEILSKDEFKRDPKIPMSQDPRFNKMLPYPKLNDLVNEKQVKGTKTTKTTAKPEGTTIGIMPLQEKKQEEKEMALNDISHSEVGKISHPESELDDTDDDINYDDYYNDDDDEEFDDELDELEPLASKNSTEKSSSSKTDSNKIETDEEPLETIDYDGEDDSTEDEAMDMEYKKLKKDCPRDCICERNMHSYFVATCSRLDLDTQTFTPSITDLQVIDVGPQYPIVLGAEFFKKIGLKNVKSIKISNSSVEYISPSAFAGLDALYSVNLSSIGIGLIHPDVFATNSKLKLLTLSGNNLKAMQTPQYSEYMLKSPSIEEIDFSNCHIEEFLPTAFNELKNIVFINLSGNKLKTLPAGLFDKVETIEELDLSHNKLSSLPKQLFNRTALAILHIKYNDFSTSLDFVTKDLQRLDVSYNQIKSVDGHMFKNMEGLNNLILKGNGIRRINLVAFNSLKNLRHIDLSYNDLEQISAMTFFKNPDLDVIRINDNRKLMSLPLEGFECEAKTFNTYLLDASNCNLGEMGENTFNTMPQLTRLNLAWNNIQSINKNLFSPLEKLMELDLSNNLLNNLDDFTFSQNNDLHKLNLGGNPLEILSSKLFLSTEHLSELDLSDCDLTKLWHDSSAKLRADNLLANLKFLNVSNNDIQNIFSSDLATMSNLRVFDLKNNPLKCDTDFRSLMKWLGTKKVSLGNKSNKDNAEMNTYFIEEMKPAIEWNELARKICKRDEENQLVNEQILDAINEDVDDDDYDTDDLEYDDDIIEEPELTQEKVTKKPNKKPTKIDKVVAKSTTIKPSTSAPAVVDSIDNDNSDDEYDYEEEDDDEDEDKENEDILETIDDKKDNSIFYKGVEIIQNIESRIIGGAKSDENDDDNEDVVVEEASLPYKFMWPMLIMIFSMLAVMLVVAHVITFCMRKRGERYRQALLQSKNSIIYQKLSEDITPATPKFHRYAPIEQV